MEQFNPCLRNFIAMGKSYEKALTSVTYAAKGYFDALVRMGEMASESQGSKDLVYPPAHPYQSTVRHPQLKSFHNELLTELEKKVELDARYLNAALKKYQMEHKSKGESLEKCQAELKKLRRKSQGSKHPSKYGDKEMQGKELLSQKIPVWQQACAEPNKLPDRAMFLAQQMSGAAGAMVPGAHHPGMPISEPIPGAKPLPVPPELAVLRASGGMGQQRLMGGVEAGMSVMNGTAGAHGGEDYQQWMEGKVAQGKVSPQTQRHEVYSNTLPVRKVAPAKSKTTL
eukprot:superscaffoldBa00003617_g17330